MQEKILIVDDEDDICQILAYGLRSAGYAVRTCHSAEDALVQIGVEKPDLLLLDIMMDGMSGTDLAAHLKTHGFASVPILFLTALVGEEDVLRGFALGADDYIRKPFCVTEVVARVGAVLKRAGHTREQEDKSMHLRCNGLDVNLQDKTLSVDGGRVSLTRKEFDLLCYLMRHAGQLCSRAQLLDAVWHDSAYVLERTVDVHITHLRQKLGAYREHLQAKSGFGYMWKQTI